MSTSTSSSSVGEHAVAVTGIEQVQLLAASNDRYGGVVVEMKEHVDPEVFVSILRASLLQWRQQGKKGVWIKLPIQLANLVEPAIKEGFWYHHAEPEYLMLVYWIPETANTLPANASHRVGIGAFVVNSKGEVLVVKERNGKFKGSGVWKFPTGVVNEGEDICAAAIREVSEETGINTKFVEVLAFRQSHNSFFGKSDLFFVCMLHPLSTEILRQCSEIEEVQWMPLEEYAAQDFIQKHQMFKYIAEICMAKSDEKYVGFSPVVAKTASAKSSHLYYGKRDLNLPQASSNHQP